MPQNITNVLAQYQQVFNATYSQPVAALSSPVSGLCEPGGLSVTVPVSGPFDQTMTTEDMSSSGQVVAGYRYGVCGHCVYDVCTSVVIGAAVVCWDATVALTWGMLVVCCIFLPLHLISTCWVND